MRTQTAYIAASMALLLQIPAVAADNDWATIPEKSYNVRTVQIDDLVGNLTVDVRDGGPVTLNINGRKFRTDSVQTDVRNGTLQIDGNGDAHGWNWRHWFNFRSGKNANDLNVRLLVPKGTSLRIDGLTGKGQIGSTSASLRLETAGWADVKVGSVADAILSTAGGGKIFVGDINGNLHASTAGSGKIQTGPVNGDVHSEIAGSGVVNVAQVRHALHSEIAGSGSFSTGSVNGRTHIEIAGSGSVEVNDGEASPLHIEIMGSGDVRIGAVAVDPHIETMGSGRVQLKSYRGKLKNEGNANLRIGG